MELSAKSGKASTLPGWQIRLHGLKPAGKRGQETLLLWRTVSGKPGGVFAEGDLFGATPAASAGLRADLQRTHAQILV